MKMLLNVSVKHEHYQHSCEKVEMKAVSWTDVFLSQKKINPNNFWHLDVQHKRRKYNTKKITITKYSGVIWPVKL